MSNIGIVGMTGALFIAGGWFMHHVIITFNRKNLEITSGVFNGYCAKPTPSWNDQLAVATRAASEAAPRPVVDPSVRSWQLWGT
jgi:hypothetical protein